MSTTKLGPVPIQDHAVRSALGTVDDPEYPGISIVDLGLLESIVIDQAVVSIGLVPTFGGCPALATIASDVRDAVSRVDGVEQVHIDWLRSPAWTIDRVSPAAREALAREYTVAVRIGRDEPTCPRCGAPTTPTSLFGPSRCRSVSTCTSCGEIVEVLRA